MAYTRNPTWKDWPDKSTPVTAAKMEHIEDGIQAAADAAALAEVHASDAASSASAAAGAAAQSAALVGSPAGAAIDAYINSGTSSALRKSYAPANVKEYGAVGDGVTDDTAAFASALATNREVYVPVGVYLIGAITVPAGCTLRGCGSGNYAQGASSPYVSELRIKTGVTAGVTVSSRGNISGFMIRAQNYAAVDYKGADYPTGTGNPDTGVILGDGGGSAIATDLLVQGFALYGIRAQSVSRIRSCFISNCDTGVICEGSDGAMMDTAVMFCRTAGVNVTKNFWRFVGNRIEWNARYGIIGGGEGTYVGNLFDRNGWAGLYLASGAWGQTVTGNDFTRNGCGGDGSYGRWGTAVPGDPSYVTTTAENSCHVKIDYQRQVTITGNRFRTGQDDLSTGSLAPAYIFSSSAADGSTPITSIVEQANAGVRDSVPGYNAALYSSTGAIAGGTDTGLKTQLNRAAEVSALSYGPKRRTTGSASSITVDVPSGHRSGRILVHCTNSTNAGVGVVYFGTNASSTGYTAAYENKIGTFITAASMANVSTTTNRITITFGSAVFYNYNLEFAA